MFFSYVTNEEVCTIFKQLRNKETIGFDSFDVKILKHSGETFFQIFQQVSF